MTAKLASTCACTLWLFSIVVSSFIEAVSSAVEAGVEFDQNAFNAEMIEFGLAWDRQTDPTGTQFSETAVGDSIEVCVDVVVSP